MPQPTLHEVVSTRYAEAINSGGTRDVLLKDGHVVQEAECVIPDTHLFVRALPQLWSWLVEVGDYNGDPFTVPLNQDATFSSEPVKFIIEKNEAQLAFRRQLQRVPGRTIEFLTELLTRAEPLRTTQRPLERLLNTDEVIRHDPETNGIRTVESIAKGLISKAVSAYRQNPKAGYIEVGAAPEFAPDIEGAQWLRSKAVHGATSCLIRLETQVDSGFNPIGEDTLCNMVFPDIEGWHILGGVDDHAGLVLSDEVELILEDREAIMGNIANEAGFSYWAQESLARVCELLGTARPYKGFPPRT